MTTGLLIGRFQPPHLGHVRALRDLSDQVDDLIIAVGSAQHSHEAANPFTAGERVAMLYALLDEAGLDAIVVPMFDMHRNTIWVSHVVSQVPPFDVVYTNNPLPKRLFSEAGYDVRGFELHDRDTYEATRIRELMRDGGDWQALVPKSVAELVERFDGPQRLRDVGGSDTTHGGKTWVP